MPVAFEQEPVAESLRVDHRLSGFDAFGADLKPAHVAGIARIARQVAQSQGARAPVRCVALVGHAATWRNMATEDYFRNAMARAYRVAAALSEQLAALGLTARVTGMRQDSVTCAAAKDADVTVLVGSQGNTRPVVPNLVSRSDGAARANRAVNRRVDVTLLTARRRPVRPKPPVTPGGGRTVNTVPILLRGCASDDVRRSVSLSARACGRAYRRMRALAKMSPDQRRKAWDAGAEAVWFGAYDSGGPTAPFKLVKRFVDRSYAVFRGAPGYVPVKPLDPMKVLTIQCFDCAAPGRKVCRTLGDLKPPLDMPPVERWAAAARQGGNIARNKLKSENAKVDARHFCCREQASLGLAFRSLGNAPAAPLRNPMEPRPHKIALGPAWFRAPKLKSRRRRWQEGRRMTICHEVAHLAGVARLTDGQSAGGYVNDEDYGLRAARRLARRRPALARANADNYAAYMMALVSKG